MFGAWSLFCSRLFSCDWFLFLLAWVGDVKVSMAYLFEEG